MCDYREIHNGWIYDVRKKVFFIETTIQGKREIIKVDRERIDPHDKLNLKAGDPIKIKVTKNDGDWVVKEIVQEKPASSVGPRKEKYRNGQAALATT